MRPRLGVAIRDVSCLSRLIEDERDTYDLSLKLNGDRACLAVLDGDTHLQNRHGGWYKMTVENLAPYARLGGAWLFDGEIYRKQFHPFEVIVAAGKNLSGECPSYRKAAARSTCASMMVPWMYGKSLADILEQATDAICEGDTSLYEGLVGKRLGSRYVPLGTAEQQSPTWVKFKWAGSMTQK